MGVLGVSVVCDCPVWAVPATIAAAIVLAWELGALLVSIWRERSPGMAIALSVAAVFAGPILALGVFLSRPAVAVSEDLHRSRPIARAGLHGAVVVALALLVVFWFPAGSVVALGAAATAWAIRSYNRTTSPVKPRVKRALLTMRILAILLTVLLALRPALEYRHNKEVRGVILIGLDASSSMSRKDVPRGDDTVTRMDSVGEALRDASGRLSVLEDQADIEWFSFAAAPQPLAPPAGQQLPRLPAPDGAATAIGDSTAAAINPFVASSRDVSAVLIISDGCNNTSDQRSPESLAKQLGASGIGVYTCGAGPDTITQRMLGLNVRDLASPDEVQAFNRLAISANIECIGLAGRPVKVTCKFDDDVVDSETITPAQAHTRQTVRFTHVPLAAGFHRLRVQADAGVPGVIGETTAGKLVHVIDREMRVLYIEGKYRSEGKFISQALVAGQRYAINRVVLTSPLKAKPVPGLSDKLEDWMIYHAIILGDVPAAYFETGQIEIMRKLVAEYGKGLCMIGGRDSFGAGGWDKTPLAAAMPVELNKSQGQIEGEVKVSPTRDGLASELMNIAAPGGDVAAAWAELPPLIGANRLGPPKLASQVLAETPAREPLIVAQRYDKGRVLAIAFDTTWRWVLNPKDTAEMQRRFWRQVALYLCAPKGNVWIATDKTSYDARRLAAGQELVEVTAGVENAQGQPMVGANVTVTLTGPDKRVQTLQMRRDKQNLRASLPNLSLPGVYTLQITAPDVRPEPAEQQFEVVSRDLEMLDVLANHDLLRQVAAAGNGKYAPLSDLRGLLGEMSVSARPKMREEIVHQDLTGDFRWPLIGAILALLCAEWAVRKRKGLV